MCIIFPGKMENGFTRASILCRIVFIALIVAFLLHMIGFYTPYWSVREFRPPYHFALLTTEVTGLWQQCTATYFLSKCEGWPDWGSWFEATQAFETLGFIAALAALILIVLYIFVPATSGKRIIFILTMIACFVAAGCIILGIIIYGTKMSNLSWSFALSTIGGVIFGVSAILLVVDMLKR